VTPPQPIPAAGSGTPQGGGEGGSLSQGGGEGGSLPLGRGEGGFLERVAAVPVVAILRAADAGRFLEAGRVLYEAGVRAVEVTLTSAGALEAFARLREELPPEALLGVGTVRSAGDAERAVGAGATYLIAPDFRPEVVSWAVERGVPVVPGALTPTEIAAAWGAGIDDIGAYLAAGAAAVGIGSPLLGDAGDPGGDLEALGDRARRAVAAATGVA
jgi:2-dehydro-3-deoxyphosphogluconate aldolase/(4S)-4-hydroxy-2-oxoglutarate aldolase